MRGGALLCEKGHGLIKRALRPLPLLVLVRVGHSYVYDNPRLTAIPSVSTLRDLMRL